MVFAMICAAIGGTSGYVVIDATLGEPYNIIAGILTGILTFLPAHKLMQRLEHKP